MSKGGVTGNEDYDPVTGGETEDFDPVTGGETDSTENRDKENSNDTLWEGSDDVDSSLGDGTPDGSADDTLDDSTEEDYEVPPTSNSPDDDFDTSSDDTGTDFDDIDDDFDTSSDDNGSDFDSSGGGAGFDRSDYDDGDSDGSVDSMPTRSFLKKAGAVVGFAAVAGGGGYALTRLDLGSQPSDSDQLDFGDIDSYQHQVDEVNADNVADVAEFEGYDIGELESVLDEAGEEDVDLGFYDNDGDNEYKVGVFFEGESTYVDVDQSQYVKARLSARKADSVNDILTQGDNQ